MKNFWLTLPKPFIVGAPMEDVTDVAFRTIIARKGKPQVMFTEFTSADGLARAPEAGQKKLRSKLRFTDIERPIVAQLFSSVPEYMEAGAKIVQELGFDGVDINMGCPVDAVVKQECGSGLINNPPLARELIRAAKRGAPNIPVSVKTRIGFNKDTLEAWAGELLKEEPAVLTIHARTRKEMSKVPAQWGAVARAVTLRNEMGVSTLIVGNGDVKNIAHAHELAAETGCDGVMLGRAMFGNPWYGTDYIATQRERIEALIEHVQEYEAHFPGIKNFAIIKKHFGSYISGWDNASELRTALMGAENAEQSLRLLTASLSTMVR
jgi:nifR3 family TIM-barrel protein